MEPLSTLTTGAIAFLTAVVTTIAGKVVSKSEEKLANFFVERASQVLAIVKRKQPELAQKLETAEPGQGDGLLAEIIEVANHDPEIKAALEDLGSSAQGNVQVIQSIKNVGAQVFGGTATFNQTFV